MPSALTDKLLFGSQIEMVNFHESVSKRKPLSHWRLAEWTEASARQGRFEEIPVMLDTAVLANIKVDSRSSKLSAQGIVKELQKKNYKKDEQ